MFKQFGILNSYTLESTFYAAFNPKNQYLQSQKKKPIEDDQQVKSGELITVGHDFCSTLIAMINSKILKKKFTVDTSLNHLYQMNQKGIKKSLSVISSKDDSAVASILGFAMANRIEPNSASLIPHHDTPFKPTAKEEALVAAKMAKEEAKAATAEKDKAGANRKNKGSTAVNSNTKAANGSAQSNAKDSNTVTATTTKQKNDPSVLKSTDQPDGNAKSGK